MPTTDDAVRARYAQATAALAHHVLHALKTSDTLEADSLTQFVDASTDPETALAAIRILGADALAPQVVTGAPLTATDAATLAEAVRLYPLDQRAGPEAARISAWRDWALGQLAALGQRPAVYAPRPDATGLPVAGSTGTAADQWRPWAIAMARLSTLAVPGLDGPVHDAARQGTVPLAQGVTWAMLRRDHALAARLGRWLAFVHAEGPAIPLSLAPLLDHILLFGGGEARVVLDASLARHLLRKGPSV